MKQRQQPAKLVPRSGLWKACTDCIEDAMELPKVTKTKAFVSFFKQTNGTHKEALPWENEEHQAHFVKDGLSRTTDFDRMRKWFRQAHHDAKVSGLFYSKAGPRTRSLLRLTNPYPKFYLFGYRCVYLLNSMGISEHDDVPYWRDKLLDAYSRQSYIGISLASIETCVNFTIIEQVRHSRFYVAVNRFAYAANRPPRGSVDPVRDPRTHPEILFSAKQIWMLASGMFLANNQIR